MKCYYPKDSNGNIIGFKTPESQVYDKSGESLTDKLQEVIHARVSQDGTNHITLKARLDSMDATTNEKVNILNDTLKSMTNKSEHVVPQKFGAIGDGQTDCTQAFIDTIDYANLHKVDISIPQGKYLITGDLPAIYGNIMIVGEGVERLDGISSVIHDRRTSDNFLFEFKQEKAGENQGGGIFSLSIDGGETAKNCIKISSHNFGWDGNFHYIAIANYTHTAIQTDANDIWWSNMLIHNCGNNIDGKYAIEMIESSNSQRYSDIHIEHCRFGIHVGEKAFLNSFENCKVEASDVHLNDIGNSNNPVILINTNSVVDFPPVKFDNCYFIGMDFQHYVDLQEIPDYYDAAYFLKSTSNQPVIINSCSFFGGQGTGTKTYNSQYKYVNISNGIITSCFFQRTSYLTPGIIMYNGVFSSNRIHFANNLHKNHNTSLATTNYGIQFPDKYIEALSISIDGWFVDGFYPCNRNIQCDSNARSTNNFYYRGRMIKVPDGKYVTYVIKNLSQNKNLLGYVELKIQTYNVALINGKIGIDINHTESTNYNLIKMYNISAISETQVKNSIKAYLKNGDVYIQIPADSNGYIVYGYGLELYECFGYMDSNIVDEITEYDIKNEIIIPSYLPTYLPESKVKLDNIYTNANMVKYDGSTITKSDGLTYKYNVDGTINVSGTTNWDTDLVFFNVNKTGKYTVFLEVVSGSLPYGTNVLVDGNKESLLSTYMDSAYSQKQYTGNIASISSWIPKGTNVNITVKLAVAEGTVDFDQNYVSYTGDTGKLNLDVAQLKKELLELTNRVSSLES